MHKKQVRQFGIKSRLGNLATFGPFIKFTLISKCLMMKQDAVITVEINGK